jgi:hypothetical protein
MEMADAALDINLQKTAETHFKQVGKPLSKSSV